jgi:septum formation protein
MVKYLYMRQIILASTSPRRKALLKKSGIKFRPVNPGYLEHHHKYLKPKELVVFLAIGKAKAAAKKYPKALIIAADTVVEFHHELLGKPKNKKDAERILGLLKGKLNRVITGYAVLDAAGHRLISGYQITKVYFKNYNNQLVRRYIASGQPLDKAGAYAIQDMGGSLVKKVVGDRDSAVGLPVKKIKSALKILAENKNA